MKSGLCLMNNNNNNNNKDAVRRGIELSLLGDNPLGARAPTGVLVPYLRVWYIAYGGFHLVGVVLWDSRNLLCLTILWRQCMECM